jgi:hypothetical protein
MKQEAARKLYYVRFTEREYFEQQGKNYGIKFKLNLVNKVGANLYWDSVYIYIYIYVCVCVCVCVCVFTVIKLGVGYNSFKRDGYKCLRKETVLRNLIITDYNACSK